MENRTNQVAEETSIAERIGNVRWTVCAMLFAATTINYMDRQVIGLLKPILMLDAAHGGIALTEVAYSNIVAFFQFAYALGLIFVGRFVDKVGTRIGYACIMAAWSVSAMAHALVNSVLQLGIARTCLGIGESGNFPAAIKTVAEWFPQKERSLTTGIFNSGANVGAILAPLAVPWVAIHFGWHAAFLITGGFSALWILIWLLTFRKPTEKRGLGKAELNYINSEPEPPAGPAASWLKLIGFRQTWGFAIGKFLTDPIWWFYLYWLPSFFSKRYQMDLSHLGLPLIIVYNASTIGSIGGGWLPIPFRKLGLSAERARLAAMLVCACAVAPVILINYTYSMWVAVGLLSLAAAAHQGWSANIFSTTSDMFPRSAVGSVTGIGSMAGSVGGILLAKYIGYILDLTGSYATLFIIAGSAYLVALLILVALAPGLRKVNLAA
jgi:ACS family hexuronate transporter-like MFS transporter